MSVEPLYRLFGIWDAVDYTFAVQADFDDVAQPLVRWRSGVLR
jgi:hypothetical protein